MNTLTTSAVVLALAAIAAAGYFYITAQTALAERAQEEENKKLVLTAYQALFGDHDLSALEKYWGEPYIQHNPLVPNGKAALGAFVQSMIDAGAPKSTLDVKRVAAEGDYVWVHLRSSFGEQEVAIVDIFRVEQGKIVEHWDVIQPVPVESANSNTMF
ncbi:hypothetical protein A3C89_01885 [Candidatus Kaiserbacteria bacterium RIFCSPHIGHO2_02_FULL_50_50]|uniref:SnoaL-like domain-containing protein n=1 Tax=Candidatus Kaiserbacteria bacterium RIFCSPHIGHO2_02_FULL_50_50 TaxID=1798492 RepID=A0A1F6DCU2_9BACT|nr:MAG: hypothetical protein A3C89_01885 [Candidatus Kaiserbacteria bacterium RIFCSPHIGHO2_02_FULL_50_50]OGG89022.1 MAG: hypothetical protein A3G62_04290 [Candidatus Kaiserbacteria bacterium RIFCSPLOWO2_12_FULL_50_10]